MAYLLPSITFFKQILVADDHNRCQFCDYGGENKVVWRIEFKGKNYSFHWLACNRCRFMIFKAFGGKRINTSESWKDLLAEPKQQLSIKDAKSSKYWALSWDRREALDRGESIQQYEARMFAEMDKKREAEKKGKVEHKQEHIKCKYELPPDKYGLPICGHKGAKDHPFKMPCHQQNCPWSARQDNQKWWKNHPDKMKSSSKPIKKKNISRGLV